jgi:biopolymer transport protein ExbD
MSEMAGGSTCEPNLTPLLDLVLQLLMFFIITVNFVSQQVTKEIELPDAQSAKPMDKDETEVLFINMNEKGQVLALGVTEPMDPAHTLTWLNQQYQDAQLNAKDNKVNTVVVIRAHKNADYADVYQLLRQCKGAGFRRLQLRAIAKG